MRFDFCLHNSSKKFISVIISLLHDILYRYKLNRHSFGKISRPSTLIFLYLYVTPSITITVQIFPVKWNDHDKRLIELASEYLEGEELVTSPENTKQLLYTAEASMVYGFRDEMGSHPGHRQTFGDMEYQLNKFNILPDESMRNGTMEKIRQHYYVAPPNVNRFVDVNNNNDDPYSMVEREMSNVMSVQSKSDFELKEPYYFNDNFSDSHCMRIDPPDCLLSIPNKNMEQIEPMDLSCGVKNKNSKAANKTYNEIKNKNYFESNSEISLPLPSNISEAALLILKSVYDVKYHRKPNCDKIFHEDPADPRLYVCKVCSKHVRSKWHHFQTHYSRDHKCSDCDAVYSRIDTLRTHAKKRHRTVIPRYYYGIPANVWHRVVVQCPADPQPAAVQPPQHPPPSGAR